MPSTLTAGIIGAGFMAEVHSRAVRWAGGRVAGVAASSPERGAAAAARLGAERGYSSAEALLRDPAIDVVHICTPNDLHAEFALGAIRAGKAVVCEKPLATTAESAVELEEAAREAGARTAVPFVYRFYPVVREIRARLERGEAGRLVLLHGSYLQDWLAASTETNWRVDKTRGGASRAFADIGVHWCDLVEFVTGHRIVRVAATIDTAHSQRGGEQREVGTEDIALILFTTDGGASGSLTVSQVSIGRKNRLRFSIDGTRGSFEFDQEAPNQFWNRRIQESALISSGGDWVTSPDAQRLTVLPPGHPQGYQDAFNGFMVDAYSAFAGTDVPGLPTFADGRRAAFITTAVLTAAATQTWVDVPELASAIPRR
jgi:predicted dehydrogenase